MRVIVSKKISFDAAHHLPGYNGPCSRIHGHTWEVEIGVSGDLDTKTGMVIDFKWIKKLLTEGVVDRFDHQDLNTFFPMPTAENIAIAIWDLVLLDWVQGPDEAIDLEYVKVWESPDSCVEVRG